MREGKFKSLNLPILEITKSTFTATTSQNGGWLDTAFSGLATNQVLLSVIDNSQYGIAIRGTTAILDEIHYSNFWENGLGCGGYNENC